MRLFLLCLLLLWATLSAWAQDSGVADGVQAPSQGASTSNNPETAKESTLRFEDFPAKIFQKKAAKNIQIHPNDSWVKAVKPDIREAMKHGADFAGHFSVVLVNCGTACIAARMIDLRTGQLFWIPGGYQLDLEYHVGSRLMRVAWVEPSENAVCVRQDFEWTGRKFVKRYEDREKAADSSECPGLEYIRKPPQ
ncbi:hypothetical protein FJV76_03830 [Mesorhizobium sp. WSM4303]|uniref:hypothetical protein n=1 Tax=unclassified Mesorhizobium TaxID=325217 RepID=UPI00115F3490|nr:MULTISPECIES: hypothetical protein [unclassified Mesorhizobium]TRD00565.1 hypothetical protein FJV77_01650 [Mesorhizobium sp. WSM4306]TRD07491.1 hypothetical protein FJV76_03830 [Mesorhizobium sp. WSM4303]